MKKAVIDLGTNTFHLLIAEAVKEKFLTLHKTQQLVRLGEKRIQQNLISSDAIKRAVKAVMYFKDIIDQYDVMQLVCVATSAIRNASNGQMLIKKIKEKTGIYVDIISGDKEAELIFGGVKRGFHFSKRNQLIMDIGGGSVEFIIGNKEGIIWKKSYEIGAQRLLDLFHSKDPIPLTHIQAMNHYFETTLYLLIKVIQKFKPQKLIGCSGSFDTLIGMYHSNKGEKRVEKKNCYLLPISAYIKIHELLIHKKREERLTMPGMIPMRVDMIVVASCLIYFVVKHLKTTKLVVSPYSLKEGLLYTS